MSANRKIAIVSTAIFSMIANAFAYFNLMPHHDAINHALYFAGNWVLSLGRFLLIPYGKIFGNIYMPWLNGWLSIVFLTVSVCLICEIYNMNKKVADCFNGRFFDNQLCHNRIMWDIFFCSR